MPRLKLPDLELEYESLGDSDSPAVVMIRGLGTQMVEWPESLLRRLVSAGYRVVIFDNRDSGLSSKMQSIYELDDMVNDTLLLMTHLAINAAHIVGLSMGGIIAQFIAADHPDRLLSLTSIMSTSGDTSLPMPSEQLLALMSASPDSAEEWVELTLKKRRILRGPAFQEPDEEARHVVESLANRSFDPSGTIRQQVAAATAAQQLERFERIQAPTLVIHGDADELVSSEHGMDTARRINGAKFVEVANMGHVIPEELGDSIAELLHDFYRNL